MNLPDWTPNLVKPLLRAMYLDPTFSGTRRDVVNSLIQDSRMRCVYRELLRFDRTTGSYYHAAICHNASSEEAQLRAIGELLELVVIVAADRVAVTTYEEVSEEKQFWQEEAQWLRTIAQDMKRPAMLGALTLDERSPVAEALGDLEILTRIADRLERFANKMRRPDDLLVVTKHRGDPVVRALQILIGARTEKLFGKRLDGTAATLAGIALNAETSPRASRSALTATKSKKKRSSI